MLRKIGSRWWLIVLSIIVCVGTAAVVNYNMAQFYTGRTTLLEVHPPASSDQQTALNTLLSNNAFINNGGGGCDYVVPCTTA